MRLQVHKKCAKFRVAHLLLKLISNPTNTRN